MQNHEHMAQTLAHSIVSDEMLTRTFDTFMQHHIGNPVTDIVSPIIDRLHPDENPDHHAARMIEHFDERRLVHLAYRTGHTQLHASKYFVATANFDEHTISRWTVVDAENQTRDIDGQPLRTVLHIVERYVIDITLHDGLVRRHVHAPRIGRIVLPFSADTESVYRFSLESEAESRLHNLRHLYEAVASYRLKV